MYQTILFDLDGTLTDSGPGIMKAGQYALRAFGIERDWRELSFFVGPPLSETFARFVSAENVDAAVAKFREYYQQDGWLDNAPYPGIPALLAHLKSEGKRLFVATSKLDTMAERILEHFGLAPYFDAICGAPEGDKEAGKKVKEEGLENDLCERILADPMFMITKEEMDAIMAPENFTGRSAQQVEEFVSELVQPILEANKDILNETFEMKN